MSNTTDKKETARIDGTSEHPHIWLRYATQFTTGGRIHTLEIGIPVPLGASAETRAKLIREAEIGMDQLSSYVENRVTNMLPHNQRPSTDSTIREGRTYTSTPVGGQGTQTAANPQRGQLQEGSPHEETQRGQITLAPAHPSQNMPPREDRAVAVPPTRPHVGGTMPLAPGAPADAKGNMTLTQFLHFIRETLGLTHQQARELLQVPSLNGVNLRDALERLQALVAQKAEGSSTLTERSERRDPIYRVPQGGVGPTLTTADPSPVPQNTTARPLSITDTPTVPNLPVASAPPPVPLKKTIVVKEESTIHRFDEEADADDEEDIIFDESEEEPGLTAEELLQARTRISKLKEIRGSQTISTARLNVFNNVIGDQISQAQLQRLLQSLWGTTTLKKLKNDQAEELISWAKEDNFVTEAEAILTLLEEE